MAPRDIALVLTYCYLELYSFTVLLLKLSSMIILIGRLAQPHVISATALISNCPSTRSCHGQQRRGPHRTCQTNREEPRLFQVLGAVFGLTHTPLHGLPLAESNGGMLWLT